MWKWLTDQGQTPERYAANPISHYCITFWDARGKQVFDSGVMPLRYHSAEPGPLKIQEYTIAMKMRERFRDALFAQARTNG